MANQEKKGGILSTYSKTNVLYGLVNTFSTLRTQMGSNYQQFFLTSVVMLPTVMAANISTISSTIGTICTIFLGFIMQKSNPKMGRFRFWMLLGGIASAVSGIMTFIPISAETHSAGFVYAWYLIAMVGGVGYSVFYTPYTGCISLLNSEPADRAAMSAVRTQMNAIGKLFWSFFSVGIIAALVKLVGQENEPYAYTIFSAIISVALIFGILLITNMIKGLEKPDEKDASGKTKSVSVITMIKQIKWPMICLCIGTLGKSVCYSVVYGVMAYYYTYVAGNKAGMTLYLSLSTFILLFGGVCAPIISRKITARWTCVVGYVFYATALLLAFFVGKNANVFTVFMGIGMFGYTLEHATASALVADYVDYNYYTTGIDCKAFLFQVTSWMASISGIIKTACLGYGLAAFGFDAANVTDRAILGIRIITCLVPTAFLILGIIGYTLYPVTPKKLADAKAAFLAKQEEAKAE